VQKIPSQESLLHTAREQIETERCQQPCCDCIFKKQRSLLDEDLKVEVDLEDFIRKLAKKEN
jgi:hypothetical protein